MQYNRALITNSKVKNLFSEELEDFICWMRFKNWSPRTIETYNINIKQFNDYYRKRPVYKQ
jgi:hypothetical protein